MPNQKVTTSSKLIVEVTHDDDDLVTSGPAITLWVTTKQDRCISALTLTPDEAQKVGAMLAAAAIELES